MKLNKFTVIMAVLLMAILAIGAVSAESIDDADASLAIDDGDSDIQLSDSPAEDLSAADTADLNDENSDGGAVLTDSGNTYQITEESYSTYFNDDGTPTDALSAEGNYELQLGVLEGKNFNFNSGKNIVLSPYMTEQWDDEEEDYIEVGGDLFECSLSFGPNVESVIINGLTFHNTDKTIISVDGSKDITISDNVMFMDVTANGNYANAIYLNGAVSNINIDDNAIFMDAAASAYGINLMSYGAETNPSDIAITSNRIEMDGDFEAGMLEAIYLSNPTNLVVDGNIITVNTVNDVFAYGIQIADDVQYVYMFDPTYTGNITSPRNIVIKGNEFDISSEYMTYAVTVLDYGVDGVDEEMEMPTYNAFDTNITISDNNVIAKSTRGVIAIAGQTYNMTVKDNTVVAIGGSAEGIQTQDLFGNETYALGVEYFDMWGTSEYTVIVKDNAVITNVTDEYLSDDDYEDLVTFENNAFPNEFLINENTYSVYFNEDGTSTGILPEMGDYTLYIDFLEGKDIKIDSGSNITITAATFEDPDDDEPIVMGHIYDGSIIIGDYAGSAGSIVIDGLRIINTNKNGIEILDLTTNVTIKNSEIIISGEEDPDNPYFSVYGINANGWIEGLTISDNYIAVYGDASYSYGIQLGSYAALSNPKDITISNNEIFMEIDAGMAEAIYLDNPVNALVESNDVTVHTTGDSTFAYGIQIADSAFYTFMYEDDYEGDLTSAHDVTIKNNKFDITCDFMLYGITAISNGAQLDEDGDMERFAFPLNIVISDNEVFADSARGVMGIAGQLYNMTVINNVLNVIGGSAEGISSGDALGNGTYALGVQYNNRQGGYYVIVKDNKLVTNVTAEFLNSETYRPWVTFENNTNYPDVDGKLLINDDTYDSYFDENGNIKEDSILYSVSEAIIGDLTNKKLVIDIPLSISAVENTKLVNSTINLVEGADGSKIDGLTIEFEGNSEFGIIYAVDVSNITISNNKITVTDCTSTMMPIEVSANGKECSNIEISANTIDVTGDSNYIYGIDAFAAYWNGFYLNNINISDNEITLTGGAKMAEAIYVSGAKEALIENNEIDSTSPAVPYAIATDNSIGVEIYNNTLVANATSGSMAYALTSAFDKDVSIKDNVIIAEGQGAVGIGFRKDSAVAIDGNAITTIGDDFTIANTTNRLGQANAAILNKDGITDVTIGDNTIVEIGPKLIDDTTYSQFFDENGKLKEDCTIAIGDTLLIGDLTNKDMIIDIPVDIKGMGGKKQVNTTVSLVAGADGTSITGLDMDYEDDGSATFAIIAVNDGVSDVIIADNTINAVTAQSWNYNMAISVYGSEDGSENITITGNTITMTGESGGLYGIDVQNYDPYWHKLTGTTGLNISDNTIEISGTGMVEPIYVFNCEDVLVDGNKITSSSTGGDAYGIGTGGNSNINVTNNEIEVCSENNMAYGISSTNSTDVVLNNNNITATGLGAVGIGIQYDENVEIEGNNIGITGGDFTTVFTYETLGTANAAILNKDESNKNLNIGDNTLTENGKETDIIKTGDGGKDLQNLVDATPAGSTLDLTGQYFNNVANVEINKDIAITGGTIIGKEGEPIFVLPAKSEGGPSEFNLTDSTIKVNNANTIVKATADNDTNPTAIDTPNISIKNNNIELANEDVVSESVTVLELDSERPILAPTGEIAVTGNTLAAGVDPFDFEVTSVNSGGDTVIPAGPISSERTETEIVYENMTTTAVDVDTDGRVGELFYITLKDKNGNLLANKPVQIGFNGNVYDRVTNENGSAKLQINLKSAGTYTFAVSYLGDDVYNGSFVVAKIVVNKQKGSLTVPNKSYSASSSSKTLTATFKSASGKVVSGKKVTFTVNGKTYSATTDSKGVATVKVSLNTKGTYSFTAKFAGNNMYAAMNKTAKLTIK